MYTRKIDHFFKEFKTKNEKKAIVIKGTRQVGKTTTALNYAKNFIKM